MKIRPRILLSYLSSPTKYFTGSITRSAKHRYLSYSEGDFEVFRPAGATYVAPMGMKFGMEEWTGFVTIGRYEKVVNGHKSTAQTDSPDDGTGRTCLGEGMHCPSASSSSSGIKFKYYAYVSNNTMIDCEKLVDKVRKCEILYCWTLKSLLIYAYIHWHKLTTRVDVRHRNATPRNAPHPM